MSTAQFGPLVRVDAAGSSVYVGNAASSTSFQGTGCCLIGNDITVTATSSTNLVCVGASQSIQNTAVANAVLVGYGASTTTTGNGVAIGRGAVLATPNSIVIGSQAFPLKVDERAGPHQRFFSVTLIPATATSAAFTAGQLLGGWIAFEDRAAGNINCTVPTYASMIAALPNPSSCTAFECVLSNYSTAAATVTLQPNTAFYVANTRDVGGTQTALPFAANRITVLRIVYLPAGVTVTNYIIPDYVGPAFVAYI